MCCGGWVVRHLLTVGSIGVFLFWTSFVTGFGILTLQEDLKGKAIACNAKYHLIKYSVLNVMFAGVVLFSYFLWKGGGEGARARALLIMLVHFALGTWGLFAWQYMGKPCIAVFDQSFSRILEYQQLCTVHNTAFFFLYLIHEIYLGEKMQADYTLFVELAGCGGKPMNDYPYAIPSATPAQDAAAYNVGVSWLVSPGMQPAPDPPPHSPPHLTGLP